MSTITERVAAGAAFLDEHDPEWWRADVGNAIDLDTLSLESTQRCILGQRCPLELIGKLPRREYDAYYVMAAKMSGASLFDLDLIQDWAAPLGFMTGYFDGDDDEYGDDDDGYGDLTDEWARVIRERRSAVTPEGEASE
jgi:hypothetical protein